MKTNGPLVRCLSHPRYFADASGKPVLLAGLHTWNNLQDMGPGDPPFGLDFDRYLGLLIENGHNFTRLWAWDMLCTWRETDRVLPFPWERSGPGEAADGKPRFDLERFDEAYFDRLEERLEAASKAGVYVSVMLFESWAVHTRSSARCDLHLFAGDNNVNGIDILGSERDGVLRAWCTLDDPRVVQIQKSYVRKVVERLNRHDNVLYEISNEAGGESHEWQDHLVAFIREVESALPYRHPVAETGGLGTKNRLMYASAADYVAPDAGGSDGVAPGYRSGAYTWGEAPFDRGDKVVVLDTDHLWGIGGDASWAWKSFCRGYNLLYMDPCTDQEWWFFDHPSWSTGSNRSLRAALGKILHYASRMDLSTAAPHPGLATSTYCLATPGRHYLVYQEDAGALSIDLAPGEWQLEHHWPARGSGRRGVVVHHAGGWMTLPVKESTVVFLDYRGSSADSPACS